MRATKNFEDKAYFKTLVRFPKNMEAEIRETAKASGDSLNGFIVSAVREKMKRDTAEGVEE